MQIKQLLSDIAIGMIGGYVGTKVMEPVSMKLYELEPEADRQPGGPGAERRLLTRIASRKTAALLGLRLTDKQVERAGLVFHYGLGMSGTRLSPPASADPTSSACGRARRRHRVSWAQ